MSETDKNEIVEQNEDIGKRVVQPTLKGLEHSLQTKISSRRALLGQLTEKQNQLHNLMDDDVNVENVEQELLDKYEQLINMSN